MRLPQNLLSGPSWLRQEALHGFAHPAGTPRTAADAHNPKPGRRWHDRSSPILLAKLAPAWCLGLLICVALCGISEAGMVEKDIVAGNLLRSEAIMVDPRPSPVDGRWIGKRQNANPFGGTSTTATPAAVSSTSSSSSSAAQSTTVATTSSVAPSSTTNSPLPRPFDSSIGSNFTGSACPNFFNYFLQNDGFQRCLPFSQLLQNSNSFFQVSRSITRVTQTLDTTCNVDYSKCSALMASLGNQLRDNNNCGLDYDKQNSLVQQAYNGFVAYSPLLAASCLKDGVGNYCFGNAVTNASNPSDAYIYYLALGTNLPGSSRPTCSTCLKETMRIFANAAGNLSQPVSTTYSSAATQINSGCGPEFVNSTVIQIKGSQPGSNAAAASFAVYPALLLVTAMVGFWGLFV